MQFTILGVQKSIGPKEWASYAHHLGGEPSVGASTSFAATAVAGQRSVSIAGGTAMAYGIDVEATASETVPLARPADAGRWNLIAIERAHQSNGTVAVSLVVLQGPATTETQPTRPPTTKPTGWVVTPGVKTHQALHWVWVASATSTIAVFDVRVKHAAGVPLTIGNLLLQRIEVEDRPVDIGQNQFVTLAQIENVYTEDAQPIDVNGWMRWYPKTNAVAAGKVLITLNDRQITAGPRDHNEGRDFGPRQVFVTGRGVTKPGLNVVKLVANTEATSAVRVASDFVLEAWKR
jgi:hypothetical protein